MKASEFVTEKWSQKYKSSINCSHPKGFSQRAHCAGKKKHNESVEMEQVCPDCGMCQTHSNISEVKQRLDPKCWKGKHKEGTKIKGGVRVNNCVPNESQELDEIDRRGFLKGAGAALGVAALGSAKNAKGQTIGGGEDEAKSAANNAAAAFFNLAKGSNRPVAQNILTTIKDRIMQYYNFGGQNIPVVSDMALKDATNAVYPDFQAVYAQADKDKEDTSMVGTYLSNRIGNRLGVDVGGRDSQLKIAGSLERFNLESLGQKFIGAYTKTLQQALEFFKQQAQQPKKVKEQGIAEKLAEEFDLIESAINQLAERNQVDAEAIWEDLESLTDDELYVFAATQPVMEDWQKVNKKDKTDGMSKKAVSAYRREHPGSKLKTAVTTKPSKLKKGSKASKRRKSYCSRSKGQMKMHNISCAKTPDKAICKARRRWNC